MKRKEKEHLKEDPFQLFISKLIDIIKKFRREILIVTGIAAVLVIIILLILFLKNLSSASENTIFSQALKIKNSPNLSIDQKIEQLNSLENRKGLSSAVKLYIAALYFSKGDAVKAKETLDQFKPGNIKLINEKKELLDTEILISDNKEIEALSILHKIFSDSKSEISKDFLLLKIAGIQIRTNQNTAAAENLNKIINEFQESIYAREAQTLLNAIKQ